MRVTVIGTFIKDVIYHWDGSRSHSLGGLMYTLIPLKALLAANDELTPVCRVGEDIYDAVVDRLTDDPITRTEGLIKAPQLNNNVELRYFSPQERQERSLHPLPPFTFAEIEPFLDADALFINMISGWELDAALLGRIRKSYNGLIFLDIHSLALGRKKDGTRFYRPIPQGKEWLFNADVIQLNRSEWQALAGEEEPEIFLKDCCFNQHKIVNLLLSWEGSKTFILRDGAVDVFAVAPPQNIAVVDPTGCGDAYLAGFGITYLKTADPHKAARTANRCAALMGSFKGLPESKEFISRYRTLNGEMDE